jgi:hypothetical protein
MNKYGEKDGLKNYNLKPETWDKMGIGLLLTKVEFWAFQYDFSFQFWGVGNNNVYINRSNVELASFGGFDTIKEAFERVLEWCEKANPRIKYPESIIGKQIDLPD